MYIFILSLFFIFQTSAIAREPYHAAITVDGITAHVSDPNLVDLSRSLKTTSLELLIPIYTPVSPLALDINLRGIDLLASFPADSTTLTLLIPDLQITETFTGGTRDESIKLMKDFIRDGAGRHRLLRAYAKFSPIDPIAGNPNSLMAQMAQSDYRLGRLSPLSGCDCSWNVQPIVHQFQVGLNTGRAFSKGFDTTVVTLPLRYSFSPCSDWAFILDAPLTYLRNGGASSLVGSVGLAVRIPVTTNWSLTPILRSGSGGTLDLCTSGSFIATGLTSVFNYKIGSYVLSLTDYAAYFSSINLWLTGVNFNYHLHNYIFKNGLSITSCDGFTFCQRPVNFSLSFVDSSFSHDHLYINHYDEIELTLIANGINPCLNYDALTVGFAYQWGQKQYQGCFLNVAYQF